MNKNLVLQFRRFRKRLNFLKVYTFKKKRLDILKIIYSYSVKIN